MPWVRFDDQFPEHNKIRDVDDGAFRLHVAAICWCNRNLTDGRIGAKDLVHVLANRSERWLKGRAAWLVHAGLWKPTEDGWLIHDYLEYQFSAEHIRAGRKAAAERQKRYKEAKKQRRGKDGRYGGNAVSNAVSNGVGHASPDPVPDPEGVGSGRGRTVTSRNARGPRAVPDWCGECDENTRHIEITDDDLGTIVARCTKCHPLREETA